MLDDCQWASTGVSESRSAQIRPRVDRVQVLVSSFRRITKGTFGQGVFWRKNTYAVLRQWNHLKGVMHTFEERHSRIEQL